MTYNYEAYVYAIAILLPIAAAILVFEPNPYHALVIRGILGAISALIYAVLGAADVALTEALVGAFLATMLYMVAVRSSLVLRLGVVEEIAIAQELEQEFQLINDLEHLNSQIEKDKSEQYIANGNPDFVNTSLSPSVAPPPKSAQVAKTVKALQTTFSAHYMRVELVPFENDQDLEQALADKAVHGIVHVSEDGEMSQIKIRLRRIHEIMQADPHLADMQVICTN
jgi:uncharacterized MnhB-related membrane protein